MKARLLDQPGTPDKLDDVSEVPNPHPIVGEVRVKVYAAGLNPDDYKLAKNGVPRWQ